MDKIETAKRLLKVKREMYVAWQERDKAAMRFDKEHDFKLLESADSAHLFHESMVIDLIDELLAILG